MDFNFSIKQLPTSLAQLMINKSVWSVTCPIALHDLRLLTVTHYDFDTQLKEGEMIVHYKIAASTINIFRELFEIKFPIHSLRTIDHYNGDDNLSMEDNNSSCFNYRKILNSNVISMHSYGLAIDINPVQNPYVLINEHNATAQIFPHQGIEFLNRTNMRVGMVESIVHIFTKYGLSEWGGNWNAPLDYHHFQVSGDLSAYLSGDED